MVQVNAIITGFDQVALPAHHVVSAATLARLSCTLIIPCATDITITGPASMEVMTKGPVFRQTLVTATSSYKALAEAVSTNGVTLGTIRDGAPGVTLAPFTSLDDVCIEPRKS